MQVNSTLNGRAAPAPVLLGAQTAGTLLRNAALICRQHFLTVLVTFFVPTFPFILALQVSFGSSPLVTTVLYLLYLVSLFLASSALTVTLSDICVGSIASPRRSFMFILGERRWWRILGAGVLVVVLTYLGLILLLLPGLWFSVRSIFTSTVAVLERRGAKAAIKRSFELTRHQFWRLVGLLCVMLLIGYGALMVAALTSGALLSLLAPESTTAIEIVQALFNAAMLAIVAPFFSISMVLMYYDQRIRLEDWNPKALYEDLAR